MADDANEPQKIEVQEQSLYQKKEKIYPRKVNGFFDRLRSISVYVLLGIYYIFPWITWNDRQAVLFDLPARKFYVFGLSFWPQDFIYLSWLLIIAALALFFFTALAGRLWCGYACPQTVWTETFLWMERWVEGDRNKRMRLDKMPWNAEKIRKKTIKHFLWITFSLFTGFTFIGYFTPIKELTINFWTWNFGPWETFWWFFYAFATYGNAGFMREQVCLYMCPYARFQSAMFDKDTLIISYDEKRGENRGGRSHSSDYKAQGLGDCIDCKQCVHVCPTGIDIRDGLQYECIGCAACVDICDEVMDKMGYDRGLIKYTTQHAMAGTRTHVIRPRMIVYGIILMLISAGFWVSVLSRTPLELDIIRDRNRLYRDTFDGLVENVYTLKILNKDEQDHRYEISVSGLPQLKYVGKAEVNVRAGEVLSLPVRVQIDPGLLTEKANKINFYLKSTADDGITAEENAAFIGPALGR